MFAKPLFFDGKNLFSLWLKWKRKLSRRQAILSVSMDFPSVLFVLKGSNWKRSWKNLSENFRLSFIMDVAGRSYTNKIFSVFGVSQFYFGVKGFGWRVVLIFIEIDGRMWSLSLSLSSYRHDSWSTAKNYVRCGDHETIIKQKCFGSNFIWLLDIILCFDFNVFVGSSNWTL